MASPAPVKSDQATQRRDQVRRNLVAFRDTRDPAALDFLVCAHQGLAYSLAGRFAQRGEEIEDLHQVALLGLLKAIERFDPDRGVELTTFATATILGELKRHLRDRGWWVRPPRRVHDLYISAQQAMDELTQRLGRSPTIKELSAHLDVSIEEVVEAIDAGGLRNSTPLESPGTGGEEAFANSLLGVKDPGLAEVEGRMFLTPLLERLPERDRMVIRLRFIAGWSQTQIGAFIGATQMQVSRMLARSLAQLRVWSEREYT